MRKEETREGETREREKLRQRQIQGNFGDILLQLTHSPSKSPCSMTSSA